MKWAASHARQNSTTKRYSSLTSRAQRLVKHGAVHVEKHGHILGALTFVDLLWAQFWLASEFDTSILGSLYAGPGPFAE